MGIRVLQHLRRNAVAYLALFVALSSGSYAASSKLLPANSVGTKQVINGSLQKVDFSARTRAALRGAKGPRGLQGPQGPAAPQGPAGPQGAAGPQGRAGPQGPAGPQGAAGPKGDRGAAGTAFATRIRNVGSVTGTVTWPLTGNVWTQSATATDLLYGVVTARSPSTCTTSDPDTPGYGVALVYMDNEFVGSAFFGFSPNQEQQSPLYMNNNTGALLAPGTDTTHVMTATVDDVCTGVGEDFTFESFKVDVISVT